MPGFKAREILYSPGYGSGYGSWILHERVQELVEDPVLIQLVKDGKHSEDREPSELFRARIVELVGEDYVCLSGVHQLQVMTVDRPYRITDHDGYERVEECYDEWFF